MGWNLKRRQDTGTLDIASLATDMTGGSWTIRRVAQLVYMALDNAAFTPTQGTTWQSPPGMIPAGFRPVATPPYVTFPSGTRGTSSLSAGGLRVSRYGGVDVYDVASKRTIVICTWVTDDPWPTTLPGVKL